jgi:hypothetical protein
MRRAILIAASLLVPADQREDWRAEWLAELWHAERLGSPNRCLWFCLGGFKDALWMRRNNKDAFGMRHNDLKVAQWQLKSPGKCLAFLAALACAVLIAALIPHAGRSLLALARNTGDCYGTDCELPADEARKMILRFPLVSLVLACIVLPVTTGISLGEVCMSPGSAGLSIRLRRWFFLGAKVVLIITILAGLSLYATQTRSIVLLNVIAVFGIQFGGVFALRWAVRDQRARCPVCLRLMAKPVDVGQPSRCLIDWECTELICLRGHGFLHVPGVSASWRNTQSWHYLDPSWSSLFSRD